MQRSKLFSVFMVGTLLFSVIVFGAAIDQEKIVMVKAGDRLRLGVVVSDVNKDKHDTKVESGAYIIEVIEDGPAEKAGLKKGDVIVKFDGKKVSSADDLGNLVSEIDDPKEVKLDINRDGKTLNMKATLEKLTGEKTYTVTLGDHDFDFHTGVLPKPGDFNVWVNKGDDKGGFLGVQAKDITESMLSYFDVDYGVLVEEVVDDSPAHKAGFKAGDVIMKINDREIKDYSDLIRTLNFYNPDEKVKVQISRKGDKKDIPVTLGEKTGKAQNIKIKKMLKGDKDLHWIDEDDKTIEINEEIEHGPKFRFFDKKDALRIRVI